MFDISQTRSGLSGPTTPEFSNDTLQKLGKSPQHPSPLVTKKSPGVTAVVIQSKEGPEILSLLKGLRHDFHKLDSKLAGQSQKLELISGRLTNVETSMRALQAFNDVKFDRPDYLPFTTQEDIKEYDTASKAKREEMRNYLLYYNMSSNPKDNAREILQKNRLMTDTLLTQVMWIGRRGQKTTKLALMPRCITHDLRNVMKQMYPEMTHNAFKTAISKSLNAANSRVTARKKTNNRSVNAAEHTKKETISEEEYFCKEWSPINENQFEVQFEVDDVENGSNGGDNGKKDDCQELQDYYN